MPVVLAAVLVGRQAVPLRSGSGGWGWLVRVLVGCGVEEGVEVVRQVGVVSPGGGEGLEGHPGGMGGRVWLILAEVVPQGLIEVLGDCEDGVDGVAGDGALLVPERVRGTGDADDGPRAA